MGTCRWIAAISIVAVFSASSPHFARAQDPQRTAAARALFEEGVAFAERGNWSEAVDRFERTYAIRPSPNVLYNLASARIELGQLVVGSELLVRISEDESAPSALRHAALQRLNSVKPRIARLRIQIEDLARGDEVRLDGKALDRALLDVGLPVDPGVHRIAVLRGGRQVATGEARVVEGEEAVLAVGAPPAIDPAHAAMAAERPALTEAVSGNGSAQAMVDGSDRPLRRKWWFWTTLTAIVAAGAVATYFLLRPNEGNDVVEGNFTPGVIEL